MEIDLEKLTAHERYKLMASLIVPRPIALITTLSETGVINAAPFSMFNMVGEDPPIVMVSINPREDATLKDTAINIVRTGEFVVHISDEAMAQKMHRCGDRLPSDVSELPYAGLNSTPSNRVSPPRIVEAPVAFECTLFETIKTTSRQIFIGQIRWLHVRDGLVDLDLCRVNLHDYFPVGRFGGGLYTTTRERFELDP
jgi:flavin reductase (DIM6/NTAB) family NADH-FMN oxidoreductase RutF